MNAIHIAGETLLTPKQLDEAGVISLAQQSVLRRDGTLECYRNGVKVFYSWQKHIEPYLASSSKQTDKTNDENTRGE